MYSLVSASVLAIDLARHPSGAAIADAVDQVLALTPADLDALASQRPAAAEVRQRILTAAARAPQISGLMGTVIAVVEGGPPRPARAQVLVEALAETMMGTLAELLTMLQRERPLVDADPVGVQVALDGVTAAWAGRQADFDDLMLLRGPWAASLGPLPPALPRTSYSLALGTLLEAISRRTPDAWRRTAVEHDRHRGGQHWSTAMHASCQAAYDEGRLRDVARAQLAAARVLRLSGASTGHDAHAIAMAVTAAVQATCTSDLLPQEVGAALIRSWEAGS